MIVPRRPYPRIVCAGMVVFVTSALGESVDKASALSALAIPRAFDLPADVAEKTLKLFSEQSGRGLIVAADTATNTRTNAVRGKFIAREALNRMLAGTGLVGKEDPQNGAFVVHRETSSPNGERAAPNSNPRPPNQSSETLDNSPEQMKNNNPITLLMGWLTLALTPGHAADASSSASTTAAAEDPVTLSAYEVLADKDVGYQGGNTASGSRLNTPLRDTAASIMVITKEFMNDFGMNSLEEITAYMPNMGVDMLETRSDPNPGFLGGPGADTRMRIRGLESSTAMDFFVASFPIDSYNVDRFEVSSGPNSILFGFGNPGGLVNVMTKTARIERNRTAFRAQFGDWDFQRYEVDHNQVLVRGKLAARLNTLYEHGQGWRTNDFKHNRRGALSIGYKPLDRTNLTLNGEIGRIRSHVSLPSNAEDQISLWTATGSLIRDDAVWTTADRALGVNRNTAVMNYYVTNPDGSFAYYLPTRNAVGGRLLMTTYEDFNVPATDRAGRTLVDPRVIPFKYDLYGPAALRYNNFRRLVFRAEQKLTDHIDLDLAYNRESNKGRTEKPANQALILAGDPNLTIPNPTGAGAAIPNPNAGRQFIEHYSNPAWNASAQEAFRAGLSGKLQLGKFGTHNVAGMYENTSSHDWGVQGRVIFVDANNVPISNPTPENAANWVRIRRYITPGDFSTYQAQDGQAPITITRNGVTYHNRTIVQGLGPRDWERRIETGMLVAQSYFFDSKLVVAGGLRKERITYKIHGTGRYTESDTAVKSGQAIVGELRYTPEIAENFAYKPTTHTLGGVYHFTPAFSVFYNTSNNNAEPRQNHAVLPDSKLPPPFDGTTHDYGFMLRLLDGKFFLRATAFETAQNTVTGSINFASLVPPTNRILNALLAAGRITDDDVLKHTVGEAGRPLQGIFDEVNSGYEASAWFNVTDSFTSQINFSYTKTDRSNIAPEFEGWYERERAFWYAQPGAGSLVDPETGSTIDENAAAHPRTVRELRDFNNFGYGIQPYKVNVSGRYTFSKARLKGAFIGGGTRWASKPKLGRRELGTNADGSINYGDTIYGPVTFTMDAFVGYRRRVRLSGRDTNLTMQVNVRNLTNEDDFRPLRYNAFGTGYARVILVEPRSVRASIGLDF